MARTPRRRGEGGPGPLALALLLGALLASLGAPALARVPVARGDTLAVAVVEEPSLDGEATVDIDGRIALPGLAGVEVAGLDLDGVRARIEAALREQGLVRAPTVRVEVARHRPIYVGGGVATPGAYPFEAGLTVRRALVLAGGPARPRDAAGATLADVAGLRGRLRAGATDLYATRARIARLEREMEGEAEAEAGLPEAGPGPVPPAEAEAIRGLEEGLLDDRLTEWDERQAHLRDVVSLLDTEIDLLARRGEHQEAEQAAARADLEDARDLVERGLAPSTRLKEAEREASRGARDLLENQAFAARARQARATAEHELEAAGVTRRVELREALGAARAERVRLEAEIEALTAALLTAGLGVAAEPAGPPALEVIIYRAVDGAEEAIPATMTTEILPGDVLEVAAATAPAG